MKQTRVRRTEKLKLAALQKRAEGKSLTSIVNALGTTRATFYTWARNPKLKKQVKVTIRPYIRAPQAGTRPVTTKTVIQPVITSVKTPVDAYTATLTPTDQNGATLIPETTTIGQ